ncbi:MAG TPA: OmpA family protein [Candidatus Kapabacteria bacterium]|nr:OmpA family protein [Candidatus Kapabacteria bacterium]
MLTATKAALVPLICALLVSLALLIPAATANAQVIPDAIVLAGQVGTGIYLGEFNSFQNQGSLVPQFGFDYGLSLRYNIAQSFSLHVEYGHSNLPYGIGDTARAKYASNFFGPVGSTTYPGTTVAITPKNHIAIDRYMIFGRSNFNADEPLVPFFTLGLGLISFQVTNDVGDNLPTNMTKDYSKHALVMPIGGGIEYHFSDRFAMFGQALFYINSTDYLDGYAHYLDFEQGGESVGKVGPGNNSTPSDYFATLSLGVAWTLYIPEKKHPEDTPPPPPEQKPQPQPQPRDSVPPPPDTSMYQTPKDTASTTPADTAAFGSPNADTDGDGLNDYDEMHRYMTDPRNPDTDGDNLSDYDEVNKYNTSPNNKDTDGDGLTDGAEEMIYHTNPLNKDSDGDGLRDGQEVRLYKTNPLDPDTDRDSLRDGVEVTRMFTNPNNPDTDGDGVPDGRDECPLIAGDPANNGCPRGMPPSQYSERVRQNGPLAGLPEVPAEGDRTDFSGIYFKVNSDDFDLSSPETKKNLQSLLDYMKQCDEIGVMLEGHTSSEGNPKWNQQLSERRAERVRDWLIANGIPKEKILGVVGYGSSMPRVPEPAPGTVPNSLLEKIRKQNRRITTQVQKPCK